MARPIAWCAWLALRLCLLPVLGPMALHAEPGGSQSDSSILPAWIAGCWAGERGGERFHERWILADRATLLGTSHTVKGTTMTAFEFLRIVTKEGRAVYVAQPGGVAPTEFTATRHTAEQIVFENPRHDFPKRITYERPGPDRLVASIDGGADDPRPIHYPMVRERCDP